MNILCLNTAFSEAQIALKLEGECFYDCLDSSSKHSENLLSSVEKVFNTAINKLNLTCETNDILNKLDYLAVVVGPGSFTGLRISIATAKAILVTHPNIKPIAITSLDLMAKDKKCTACIDALSGLLFIAEYENGKCISNPTMINIDEISNYENIFTLEKITGINSQVINLTPEDLLDLAIEKAKSNCVTTENELVPLYIRPSQAEANLNANKN